MKKIDINSGAKRSTYKNIFHSCKLIVVVISHPYVICHQADQIENKSSNVLELILSIYHYGWNCQICPKN